MKEGEGPWGRGQWWPQGQQKEPGELAGSSPQVSAGAMVIFLVLVHKVHFAEIYD